MTSSGDRSTSEPPARREAGVTTGSRTSRRRSLRASGRSPRQLGTNPRALGTNPRAVRQRTASKPADARSARNGFDGTPADAPAVDARTAPPLEAGDQVAELAAGSGAQPRNSSLLPRESGSCHTDATNDLGR